MYATLTGTDRDSKDHTAVFNRLCDIANLAGFSPSEEELRVVPDQMPLNRWTLTLKGPRDEDADFLLAVTAPSAPNISPMPVQKTVEGPLFAVVVMESFFGVSRQDRRDYAEFTSVEEVEAQFSGFLKELRDYE